MSKHLAIDIGASGGKSFIGEFGNEGFKLIEIHRFPNCPVEMNGRLRWDFELLTKSVHNTIVQADNLFRSAIDSMGIDTWGVDYGLLDDTEELIENPMAYREPFVSSTVDEVFKLIAPEDLFTRTGIQFLPFNTLFQLHSATKDPNRPLDKAHMMLLMPALLAHSVGGALEVDETIASTTQLIDITTGGWAFDIIERLGIPPRIFPEIFPAGTNAGMMELPFSSTKIISWPIVHTSGHDTAAAVAAFDLEKNDVYISSGSWFLVGCLSDKPLLTTEACSAGLTNERAADGRFRILKNVTGLYLMQECQRVWHRLGKESNTIKLVELARKAEPFGPLFNPDDPSLATPGDIPAGISRIIRQSGQPAPENLGELLRCIYESIAVKCAITLESITTAAGIKPGKLQIGGGGAKNEILCKMIAGATCLKTIAGPYEAAAIGNIIVQAESSRTIPSLKEGARIVAESMQMKIFEPSDIDDWNNMKQKYLDLFEK